jgi:hypothetical protein
MGRRVVAASRRRSDQRRIQGETDDQEGGDEPQVATSLYGRRASRYREAVAHAPCRAHEGGQLRIDEDELGSDRSDGRLHAARYGVTLENPGLAASGTKG